MINLGSKNTKKRERCKSTHLQNRNRIDPQIENKLMVTKGDMQGEGV